MADLGARRRRLTVLCALVVLDLLELGASAVVIARTRTPLSEVLSGFVLTNLVLCASLGLCGALLAARRGDLPLGWLLLGAGVAQGLTGLCGAVLARGVHERWSGAPMTAAATGFSWGWPWAMGLAFPVAMLLFPTGRPAGPRWRPVVQGAVLLGVGFVLMTGLDPTSSRFDGKHLVQHWGAWPGYDQLPVLWAAIGVGNGLVPLLALASLVLRYRRGDDVVRRQLLWVLLALVAVVALAVPTVLLQAGSELVVVVIALVPAAIVIAVLRHNLLDIRLIVSRTLAWSVLTGGLLLCYFGAVSVLDLVVLSRANALLAAAALALAVNPLRSWLQDRIDRALFGHRSDPVRMLTHVVPALEPSQRLTGLAEAVATSLQLPFVSLRTDGGELATVGETASHLHVTPLLVGGEQVGELVVGLRAGQSRLGRGDVAALGVLATPLALAVQSMVLAEELDGARRHVLETRDAERRRLRRDLHDGLGPLLAAVAFRADAARNHLASRPGDTDAQLLEMRADLDLALTEVRRLVQALRPTTLDEIGFSEAVQQLASRFTARADGSQLRVEVELCGDLAALPEAVETTAYRIVVEALTNVVRHSSATVARVQISAGNELRLTVHDDGRNSSRAWQAGVGLTSMRERAAELGGEVHVRAAADGGCVSARLPVTIATAR